MPKQKLFYLDLIRALAIFGVVSIHTTHYFVLGSSYAHSPSWWLVALWATLARTAVPLFFMVSGFLILNKNTKLNKEWLKRIFWRLGLPLIFWYIFYSLWDNFFLGEKLSILELTNNFLVTKTDHLYFLQALIGLYLLAPILKSFEQKAKKKTHLILISLFLILGIGTTFINRFGFPASGYNTLNIWTAYIGYFYAGFLIANLKIKKTFWPVIGALYLTSLIFTLFAIDKNLFNLVDYFWDHNVPTVVMMSFAIFAFLANFETKLITILPNLAKKIVTHISSASYGIYLAHVFVMSIVEKFPQMQIHNVTNNFWLWEIKYVVIVFILTWIIVRMILITPILKRTVGEKT